MTHDLCYLLLLIIGTDIKLNHTNWAIHSSEHSHSLLTSASDSTSAQWRLLLHIWVTYVLGHPCHIWYSLGPKSLTHNHLTRAGPVKIRCAMTGMFDRKWEGCVSVPKHWGCFKWTLKIFARMTCWCVISLRVIKTMPYNGCSQMVSISLKIKNLSSPPPWCLLSVVGLEEYSADDWRAATSVQRAPVTWREWGLWAREQDRSRNQLPWCPWTVRTKLQFLLVLVRWTETKCLLEINLDIKKTLKTTVEPVYNETGKVLLKTHQFQHLLDTIFTKLCLFSLSWAPVLRDAKFIGRFMQVSL